MEDTSTEIQGYLNTWVHVLREVRGCTRQEVVRWATPLTAEHPELTLHEPSSKWLAGALVPTDLRGLLDGPTVTRLQRELQSSLDQGNDSWKVESIAAAREAADRVRAVVERYRSSSVPAGVADDVLRTDLPRTEAIVRAARVIARVLPNPGFLDVPGQTLFKRLNEVKFGMVRRLRIGPAAHTGAWSVDLWHDAFGLNLVIYHPEAVRLLGMLRSAFYLTPYATVPQKAA